MMLHDMHKTFLVKVVIVAMPSTPVLKADT